MKKHLSLIAALCALLAGCAKETPGPNDEPQAKKMITVTIGASVQENTKTTIGEKDGDKYPVLWSEGDKIAINGVASDEAQMSEDKTMAYFKAEVEEAENYTVVYPYTVGNASNEVTFSGLALPSYGVTDLTHDVELKPLYGVLKLSLKGTATIKSIVLSTQDGAQVTGKFEIGAEGVLTGVDAEATALDYECPTPVALNATTPVDFYIPVPAGTYNIFDVQIFDTENKSMTKKIGGGNNYAVSAGKVKEFSAFEYTVNQHMFAIASTSDLEQFAELVNAGTFSAKYESAVVAKDIEAPADWSSLDYTGVFDGRNKTISALKAPLFGTLTDAEVKNVVIAANMTNTSALNYGALAQKTAGETTIDNCKVSGTVLLDLKGNSSTNKFNFAGLVGLVGGGSISNSQSTANVQLNHPGTGAKEIHIGGIAGEVATGVTIDNCTINDQLIKANDSNGNNNVVIYIGGIAGLLNNGGTIQNCVIPQKSVNSNVSLSLRMNVNTYRAGGIVGMSTGVVQNCSNGQGVSASKSSQQISYCYLGGIVGASNKNSVVKNCTNTGTIYCGASTTVAMTIQTRIGGIVGTALDVTIDSCTNKGLIDCCGNLSKIPSEPTKNTNYFAVGGILGIYDAGSANGLTMKDWSNEGDITIRPTAPTANSAAWQVGVGGLLGVQLAKTITTTGTNSNSGKITVSKALAPTNTDVAYNYAYVGGCVGAFRGTAGQWNLTNDNGNITVGADLDNICVGGLFGHTSAGGTSHAKFYGCHVRCTLVNKFNTGLICGWSGANKEAKNCFFAGKVNGTDISADNVNTASVLFSDNTSAGVSDNAIWE